MIEVNGKQQLSHANHLRKYNERVNEATVHSPIVAVIKGPTSQGAVRLTIDFRDLNLYSQGDAFIMPHLQDTIQKVGAAQYITVLDAKSGYRQLGLREEV